LFMRAAGSTPYALAQTGTRGPPGRETSRGATISPGDASNAGGNIAACNNTSGMIRTGFRNRI